jgi:hypothetical protein
LKSSFAKKQQMPNPINYICLQNTDLGLLSKTNQKAATQPYVLCCQSDETTLIGEMVSDTAITSNWQVKTS